MKRYLALRLSLLLTTVVASGCHDGPLYALKEINPYFRHRWQADETLGPTDHTRRAALESLSDNIGSMPPDEQLAWSDDLRLLLENDENAEMRRLAVQAAGAIRGDAGLQLVLKGMEDENMKVRQAACKALSQRSEAEAIAALAEAAGSDANGDVRLVAVKYLGSSNHPQAISALRTAVQSPDPAFQNVAIASLRQVTGQDFGRSPDAWVAYLDGKPVPEDEPQETRWAERIRNWF